MSDERKVDVSGLVGLLNEVSSMLSNNPELAVRMPEFRYAMADELRGFALMLGDSRSSTADHLSSALIAYNLEMLNRGSGRFANPDAMRAALAALGATP